MITPQELEAFMNEPNQRQVEVAVNHRAGYWGDLTDDITTNMLEEADAYLEAHIQWRIAELSETAMDDKQLQRIYLRARNSVPAPYPAGTPEGEQDVNVWVAQKIEADRVGLAAVAAAARIEGAEAMRERAATEVLKYSRNVLGLKLYASLVDVVEKLPLRNMKDAE